MKTMMMMILVLLAVTSGFAKQSVTTKDLVYRSPDGVKYRLYKGSVGEIQKDANGKSVFVLISAPNYQPENILWFNTVGVQFLEGDVRKFIVDPEQVAEDEKPKTKVVPKGMDFETLVRYSDLSSSEKNRLYQNPKHKEYYYDYVFAPGADVLEEIDLQKKHRDQVCGHYVGNLVKDLINRQSIECEEVEERIMVMDLITKSRWEYKKRRESNNIPDSPFSESTK